MGALEILYWGVAYTTGIACATVFLINFLQSGDRHSFQLFSFILPFGLSIASLSLMEGLSAEPVLSSLAGHLALIGASLVAVTFPYCAMGETEDKGRKRIALGLKIAGLSLLVLNVADFFMDTPLGMWVQFATFVVLGLAIFIGMSWITRGSLSWRSKGRPILMAVLFVFFGLVMILDFFRGLIPPLAFLGSGYVALPAFYAYLNVFLVATYSRNWVRQGKGSEDIGPDAALLERHGVSDREREVLALLAEGLTYREMADRLCLSLATIKSHVSHLYEKTGTRNKVELINLLYDSKLTKRNQPNSG